MCRSSRRKRLDEDDVFLMAEAEFVAVEVHKKLMAAGKRYVSPSISIVRRQSDRKAGQDLG